MNGELWVSTPEGESGRIFLNTEEDFIYRYEGLESSRRISLTMPARREDYVRRELHPLSQMSLPEGYVLGQL